MIRTIVVAYDGTSPAETALSQAADIAQATGAQLHVLGIVVSSGGLLLDPAIVPIELMQTERRLIEGAIADGVDGLAARGIAVQTVIRDGEPTREILAYIEAVKADLVVVGHTHKGLMARWIDGSVGTRLLDAAPCSLLIAI